MSARKSQGPDDVTHMWDIKLKATDAQQTKFVVTHNSVVVTRGRRCGGAERVKGFKYRATEGDLTLGGGHTVPSVL